MTDQAPLPVLAYATEHDARRARRFRRLGIASGIVGVASLFLNLFITSRAWQDFGMDRAMSGTPAADLWHSGLWAATAAVSVPVALLLIAAGRLIYLQHATGVRWHWWYVWLKLPLALLQCAAEGINFAGMRDMDPPLGLVMTHMSLPLLLGGAYPLVIWLVLRVEGGCPQPPLQEKPGG